MARTPRTSFRNPHALNAKQRHAGYHNSERRANEKQDCYDELDFYRCGECEECLANKSGCDLIVKSK